MVKSKKRYKVEVSLHYDPENASRAQVDSCEGFARIYCCSVAQDGPSCVLVFETDRKPSESSLTSQLEHLQVENIDIREMGFVSV